MNQHQANLLQQMEQFRQLRGIPPEAWEYAGREDFLIREGTWYDPRPLPPGVHIGAPRACYGNAVLLAIMYGWRYVEGLAIPDIGVPLMMQHAWNVTPEGELIDNTWLEHRGLAYIGVPFSVGRADHAIWFDNASIFDNPRQWGSLYRHKWRGEDWNKVWRKSKLRKQAERLAALPSGRVWTKEGKTQ